MEWVLFIWIKWLWYIVCKGGCQQFLPSLWVLEAPPLKRWSVSSVLESRLDFDLLWQIECGGNAVLGLVGWAPYVLTLTRGDAICHVKKPRLSCWGKRPKGGAAGTWPTARKEAPDTRRSPAHIIRKEGPAVLYGPQLFEPFQLKSQPCDWGQLGSSSLTWSHPSWHQMNCPPLSPAGVPDPHAQEQMQRWSFEGMTFRCGLLCSNR